jgi:WD40 repeat protein
MTTLRGHRDWIVGVKFSPDGKTLASAGYEGAANLWDAQTGELKRTYDGQAGKVHSVAFSPDGKTLASGHDDGTIKLWDV